MSKLVPCSSRCPIRNLLVSSAAIEVDGEHIHEHKNPAGYLYRIGCFSSAHAALVSAPTLEHTWFLGWAWSVAACVKCQALLGWHYDKAGQSFYGLLAER